MSEKIYIVTLHKREDLEAFYSEMVENGFRLNMKRPMSRCTHYWMTSEQAEELKQDPRVWDVELNPEDAGYEMVRHSYPTSLNHSTIQLTGQYWKDDTIAPVTIDPSVDTNWDYIIMLAYMVLDFLLEIKIILEQVRQKKLEMILSGTMMVLKLM